MGAVKAGRPARRAVTRADVARYAGVSTAVVSYVVNDGPRPVAAETAARVRQAIEVLGYRPNITARALKLGSTGMLGLVVPDFSNPFFAEYALEIERVATERGLALLMANTDSNLEMEARLIVDLSDRQVDGLLVAGTFGPPRPRAPGDRRLVTPTVYIDAATAAAGHHTVGSDTAAGARLAVDHLLSVHGHETVALLMGLGANPAIDGREVGWGTALRAAGRPDGPVVRAQFSREGGYEGGLRMLAGADRPRAVFVSSDLQAVGLLRAAHESGLRVPQDLAVVGFDGTKESEFCIPPLTVVQQRVHEMAEAAVATVLDAPNRPRHQQFPMDLVVRRSCGCG